MSTHNIGFYEDLTKIIFELSSNMHLISSALILPEQQAAKGPIRLSEIFILLFAKDIFFSW